MKRYRQVRLDSELSKTDEVPLSGEDEELPAGETPNENALTEDNVAEEVLAIDDTEDMDAVTENADTAEDADTDADDAPAAETTEE